MITAKKSENILAIYINPFYMGKSEVITNEMEKTTLTYIGVDADDIQPKKDVLKKYIISQYNNLKLS